MLLQIGIILLAIAAFPYVIYLIGITFGRHSSQTKKIDRFPPISIIISAYNEALHIEKRMKNIASSTYPKELYEVIFIDDCSNDTTGELAEKFLSDLEIRHKILTNSERMGTNRSYNLGMKYAKNELIITTDADIYFEKNALEMLVSRLVSEPSIASVCADMHPCPDQHTEATGQMEKVYRDYYGRMCEWESEIDSTYNFNGGLVGFRRSIVKKIQEKKGADDANTAFETIRRGYRAFYEKNAVIYEDIPESRKVQFRQKIRRATRLIEATLSNLDLLTMNRPFSRYFYPIRIWMYLVTPLLFFAGGGIILIFLLAAHIWIGSLLLISLAACLVFIPNCIVSAFITNQFYLFLGLLRLGGDVRTWESTSRKAQN